VRAVERSAMHCDAPCVPGGRCAFLVGAPLERLFDADQALRSDGS